MNRHARSQYPLKLYAFPLLSCLLSCTSSPIKLNPDTGRPIKTDCHKWQDYIAPSVLLAIGLNEMRQGYINNVNPDGIQTSINSADTNRPDGVQIGIGLGLTGVSILGIKQGFLMKKRDSSECS